jgi:hypothetical protein
MIEKVITLLSSGFLLVNTALYVKAYKKSVSLNIFTLYLCVTLVIQLSFNYLFFQKTNNLYLSHYYSIFQFILLSLFYRKIFKTAQLKRIVEIIFATVIIILTTQYINKPQIYFEFNLLEIVLTSLSIVTFSVIYFYQSLTEKMEFMYLNYGVFIYLLSSTLIFCSGNFVSSIEVLIGRILWFIKSVLFIVYQILIFIQWYETLRSKRNY